MEVSIYSDRQLVRAARSLYSNRRRLPVVEARIEWAEAVLTNQLSLYGLGVMRLGAFVVERDDAGVSVTKTAPTGVEQLELPESSDDRLDAADGLSPVDTLEAIVALAAGDDGLPDDLYRGVEGLREVTREAGGGGTV